MDLSHYWWWIFLLLYGWLKYVQKEQKKRAAKQQAEKQRTETPQAAVTPASDWIPSAANDAGNDTQDNEEYDGKIYSFGSPVAEEEKEDEIVRKAAFQFIPAELEGETPQSAAKEYTFKPEGDFPAFIMPQEDVRAGEYFPQGIESSGEAYLSAEDIRRSIITMEILLPPRCKRPHRVR